MQEEGGLEPGLVFPIHLDVFFFFSSRRRHTRLVSDWSSDVCSSDLLRVLTYGEGLKLDDWRKVLGDVRRASGVDAAAPFVLTQGLISAGHDYAEGVVVYGVDPDTGRRAVTSFARHFTKGDLTFKTTHADVEGGIALGTRLASKRSEEHTSELQSLT